MLLFTYVMSGTASVCAFYALFAIVILATWRTSSWIGVDGVISGYRQRRAAKAAATNSSVGGPSVETQPVTLKSISRDDAVPVTEGEPVSV